MVHLERMTYSIVARDPETGAFGVATATGGPCVGALVPYAASGVGAIATQGDTNPYYGFDGLSLLQTGMAAADVVRSVTEADPNNGRRQMIAIGPQGAPVTFNGNGIEAASGSIVRADFASAGNMLRNDDVLAAIMSAYEAQSDMQFEDRLLAAMQAGEAEGGDRRGTKSAALLVYAGQSYADVDCRIDFSVDPVAELLGLVEACRSGGYARFMAERPKRTDLDGSRR